MNGMVELAWRLSTCYRIWMDWLRWFEDLLSIYLLTGSEWNGLTSEDR